MLEYICKIHDSTGNRFKHWYDERKWVTDHNFLFGTTENFFRAETMFWTLFPSGFFCGDSENFPAVFFRECIYTSGKSIFRGEIFFSARKIFRLGKKLFWFSSRSRPIYSIEMVYKNILQVNSCVLSCMGTSQHQLKKFPPKNFPEVYRGHKGKAWKRATLTPPTVVWDTKSQLSNCQSTVNSTSDHRSRRHNWSHISMLWKFLFP